tara:strand:- start:2798 stop:4339 length:1542 start_codon:yes stop_codon:yes gene_type:complete
MDGGKVRRYIEQTASEIWNGNKWVIPLVLALFASLLDPFGFSSATDQRSHVVFNRLAAPFYTPQGYGNIAVVLIDDDYLSEMGDAYPMNRYNYLDIHSAILGGSPAAIFYDFHLPSNRGNEDATSLLGSELASSASNPKNGEVAASSSAPAVWFADFGGTPDEQARYDLFGQVATLQVRTISTPIGEYAACLEPDGRALDCSHSGARASPALALYNAYCRTHDDAACEDISDGGTMVLQWSRKPEPGRQDCSPDPENLIGNTRIAAQALWRGFFNKGELDPELAQVCYPFQTIRAVDLAKMNEDALKSAFQDRVVLVGGYFSDAPDATVSPVHGQIPGVFVHATALENFFTLGRGYWRAEQRMDGAPIGLEHLIEIIVLLLAIPIYWAASHRDRNWVQQVRALAAEDPAELDYSHKRLASSSVFLFALIAIVLTIGLAIPLALSMPPTNFYGLAALTVPLLAVLWLVTLVNWLVVSIEKGGVSVLLENLPGRILLAVLAIALIIAATAPLWIE